MLSRLDSEVIITHEYTDIVFLLSCDYNVSVLSDCNREGTFVLKIQLLL